MRRKPDALKALEGTARADRANPRQPRPPVVRALRPRAGLSLPARREFTRLVGLLAPLHVLAAPDVIALELLAEALTEYRRAAAVLARHGQTYPAKTSAGTVLRRSRPECQISSEAWRRAASLLSAFGLHPSGRASLEVDAPIEDPLAAFQRRRTAGAGDPRSSERFFRE
jgi:P27 family predicted phage terminase small subunit